MLCSMAIAALSISGAKTKIALLLKLTYFHIKSGIGQIRTWISKIITHSKLHVPTFNSKIRFELYSNMTILYIQNTIYVQRILSNAHCFSRPFPYTETNNIYVFEDKMTKYLSV